MDVERSRAVKAHALRMQADALPTGHPERIRLLRERLTLLPPRKTAYRPRKRP